MVRVVFKPYPCLEFEGPIGFVAFVLGALMVLTYAVLALQR